MRYITMMAFLVTVSMAQADTSRVEKLTAGENSWIANAQQALDAAQQQLNAAQQTINAIQIAIAKAHNAHDGQDCHSVPGHPEQSYAVICVTIPADQVEFKGDYIIITERPVD